MRALDPDGEQGRGLLRRELLRPEYNEENPVLRLLDWISARLDEGLSAAQRVDPLVAAAAMVLLLLLAVAVIWLLARARTDRAPRRVAPGVLDDVVRSAAELRARAEAALAEGRHEDALADAFRALARRQVEAGRLSDLPGATAREIADSLAHSPAQSPDADRRSAETRRAADLFDGVRYGERRVDADQVSLVLRLDDELAGAR